MPAERISALFRLLFFMLFLGGGLVGCGKTGPLYLPDKQVNTTILNTSATVVMESPSPVQRKIAPGIAVL